MPWAAAIGAGGSLLSAGIGAWGASQAADKQQAAAQAALLFQQQVYSDNQNRYNTNVSNLAPYTSTGQSAMYSLASLYGLPTPNNPAGGAQSTNAAYNAFTNLPAYQFPFQQGNLALERQLNAQGKTQSGAQARETQQFGQGLASQYLMSNYVTPLMSLAGQGQSASTSILNAGTQLAGTNTTGANQIGNTIGNIGTAQASGILGATGAIGGGISGAGNNLALYSALAGGGSSYGGNFTTASNIANIGNTDASSISDAQANLYGKAMGFVS